MIEYFANLSDLLKLPKSLFILTIPDWFDKNKIILRKDDRIDNIFIKIKGDEEEQIIARSESLKKFNKVRNGRGVRVVCLDEDKLKTR